jgi:hypothetical protein
MEGFRELHNNMVPKKHDSQNKTPLNITPLTHVSDGLYIECLPRAYKFTVHLITISHAHQISKQPLNYHSTLDHNITCTSNFKVAPQLSACCLVSLRHDSNAAS